MTLTYTNWEKNLQYCMYLLFSNQCWDVLSGLLLAFCLLVAVFPKVVKLLWETIIYVNGYIFLLGELVSGSAGMGFTPHVITVSVGEVCFTFYQFLSTILMCKCISLMRI